MGDLVLHGTLMRPRRAKSIYRLQGLLATVASGPRVHRRGRVRPKSCTRLYQGRRQRSKTRACSATWMPMKHNVRKQRQRKARASPRKKEQKHPLQTGQVRLVATLQLSKTSTLNHDPHRNLVAMFRWNLRLEKRPSLLMNCRNITARSRRTKKGLRLLTVTNWCESQRRQLHRRGRRR